MEQSFASGLNFYKQFWIFFIGCFIGVVIETVWCYIRLRRFESRKGLVYGPFNLVYGFGALVMTLSLSWFNNMRDLGIIACGAFIGGIYEYACSLFQEKLLGSVSWDYKKFPLNLNGRINLLYCIFWGFLALLWVRDFYPKLSAFIELIPNEFGIILTWISLLFIIFDSIVSACVVYRTSQRLSGVKPSNSFWKYIDNRFPDERVKSIYPNMQFNIVRFDGNSKIEIACRVCKNKIQKKS